jgi:elongation factor P
MLTFMDKETFDQIEIAKDFMGDRAAFLSDGMEVKVESYEGRPITVKLPVQVTLTVTETDPAVKGQTAAPSYKPAMLENGLRVLVPPFIDVGSKIIVSTDEVEYVKRAE